MDKQFSDFMAFVPDDFEERMIQFWMDDEKLDRNDALCAYRNNDFKQLCARITGKEFLFKPDLGYSHADTNGKLCFEAIDDCFVIPVSILEQPKCN